MSRSSPVLSEIKRAVSKARTETAQRAAVIKALAAHGLHATPEIRRTKAPDGKGTPRTVRVYLFDVPVDEEGRGVALITGPGVKDAIVRAMKPGMLKKPIRVAGGGVATPTSVRSNPTPQLTVKRKYALPILEGAAARLRALGFFVTLHAEKGMDDLGITVYRDQDSSRYAALTVWLMDGDWHVSVGDSMGHSSKGWRVNVQNAQDAADALTQALRDAHIYAPDPRLQRNPPSGDVAHTILQQLGGTSRLTAMTGAKHYISYPNGVSFRFPGAADTTGEGKPNYVKIVLDASDTYSVSFLRVSGTKVKEIGSYEGIYADGLKPLFERTTGLYLMLANNPAHAHVWADKWVTEFGPPHNEKRCTICGKTPAQVSDDSDPLAIVHNALAAYGAHLTPGGIIYKDNKPLRVRARITGTKRPRLVFESAERGNVLESGPPTAATVKRFVEGFWHWTPTRSNTGGGRAELEGLRQRYRQLQSFMGRSFTKQWEANERAKAKTKARIEALAAQLGTHPWIDDGPPVRRNPLDDGSYLGFGMTEEELEAAEAPAFSGRPPKDVVERIYQLVDREGTLKTANDVRTMAITGDDAFVDAALDQLVIDQLVRREHHDGVAFYTTSAPARPALTLHRGGMEREEKIAQQDTLDSLFQERIYQVRNALFAEGWRDAGGSALEKQGHRVDIDLEHVGAGRNVVAVTWVIDDGKREVKDDGQASTSGIAAMIDSEAGASRGPPPVASSAGIPTPGSDQRRLVPGVWLYFTSPHGAKVGRIVAEPDLARNQIRVHWVGDAEPKWDYYPQIKHDVEEVASGRPPSAGIHFEYFVDKFGPTSDHEAIIDQFAQRAAARTAESVAAIAAHEARQDQQNQDIGPYYADLVKEVVVLGTRPPGADPNAYFSSYGLADTTDAKIIRQILNEAVGIKVSVTVRRYSMASGLNFAPPKGHGEWSDAEAEKIAKVFPTLVRTANYGPQHESHGKHHYRVDDSVYPDAREDKSDLQSDYHSPGGFRVAHAYVDLAKKIIARGAQDEGRVLSSAGMGALVSRTKRTKAGYAAPTVDTSAASGYEGGVPGYGPERMIDGERYRVARKTKQGGKEVWGVQRDRADVPGTWAWDSTAGSSTFQVGDTLGTIEQRLLGIDRPLVPASGPITAVDYAPEPEIDLDEPLPGANADREIAIEAAQGRGPSIELYHSDAEGTVARGNTKPYKEILKAHRFRWYKAGGFWYIPRSRGRTTSPINIEAVAEALYEAGATVTSSGASQGKYTDVEAEEARADVREEQWRTELQPLRYNVDQLGKMVSAAIEFGDEKERDNATALLVTIDEQAKRFAEVTGAKFDDPEFAPLLDRANIYEQQLKERFAPATVDPEVMRTELYNGSAFISGEIDDLKEKQRALEASPTSEALREVERQADAVKAYIGEWNKKYVTFNNEGHVTSTIMEWSRGMDRMGDEVDDLRKAAAKFLEKHAEQRYVSEQDDKARASIMWAQGNLAIALDKYEKAIERVERGEMSTASSRGVDYDVEAANRQEDRAWNHNASFYAKDLSDRMDALAARRVALGERRIAAEEAVKARQEATKRGEITSGAQSDLAVMANLTIPDRVEATAEEDAEILALKTGSYTGDNRKVAIPIVGESLIFAVGDGYNDNRYTTAKLSPLVWRGAVRAEAEAFGFDPATTPLQNTTSIVNWAANFHNGKVVAVLETDLWPALAANMSDDTNRYGLTGVAVTEPKGRDAFPPAIRVGAHNYAIPPLMLFGTDGSSLFSAFLDTRLDDIAAKPSKPASIPGDLVWTIAGRKGVQRIVLQGQASGSKWGYITDRAISDHYEEPPRAEAIIGPLLNAANKDALYIDLNAKDIKAFLSLKVLSKIKGKENKRSALLVWTEKGCAVRLGLPGEPWLKLPMLGYLKDWPIKAIGFNPALVVRALAAIEKGADCSIVVSGETAIDPVMVLQGEKNGKNLRSLSLIMPMRMNDADLAELGTEVKANRGRRRNVGLLQPGSHGLDSRTRQRMLVPPGPHEDLTRIHKAQQAYINELQMDGQSPNWAKAQQDRTIELGPPPIHRNPRERVGDAKGQWRYSKEGDGYYRIWRGTDGFYYVDWDMPPRRFSPGGGGTTGPFKSREEAEGRAVRPNPAGANNAHALLVRAHLASHAAGWGIPESSAQDWAKRIYLKYAAADPESLEDMLGRMHQKDVAMLINNWAHKSAGHGGAPIYVSRHAVQPNHAAGRAMREFPDPYGWEPAPDGQSLLAYARIPARYLQRGDQVSVHHAARHGGRPLTARDFPHFIDSQQSTERVTDVTRGSSPHVVLVTFGYRTRLELPVEQMVVIRELPAESPDARASRLRAGRSQSGALYPREERERERQRREDLMKGRG